MAEPLIAFAVFVAEIIAGPRVHIPEWMIAWNANLLTIPSIEIVTVSVVLAVVYFKFPTPTPTPTPVPKPH